MRREAQTTANTIIEGNILEYPVFIMGRKGLSETRHKVTFKDLSKPNTEVEFDMASPEGLPHAYDMDVFNAIMRLYYKTCYRTGNNTLPTSIYEILRELGKTTGGANYENVRESVIKLARVSIKLTRQEVEAGEIRTHTKTINMFSVDDREVKSAQGSNSITHIYFDDEFIQSIENNYGFLIDFETYCSLKSGLPRRLFEFLTKKSRNRKFKIDIQKLAARTGVLIQEKRKIREAFKKASEELKGKGFLTGFRFSGDIVEFVFPNETKAIKVEPQTPTKREEPALDMCDEAFNSLAKEIQEDMMRMAAERAKKHAVSGFVPASMINYERNQILNEKGIVSI